MWCGRNGTRRMRPKTRQRLSEPQESEVLTGELLHKDTRKAQRRPGNRGVVTNLTKIGVTVHDIEQSTELEISVFAEGIWITPVEDNDEQ